MGLRISRFAETTLLVAGLSLYAAEGTTYHGREGRSVEFVNNSSSLIRVFVKFLSELGVLTDEISCRVELHEGWSISRAESYWSEQSGIRPANFTRPIIKKRSGGQKSQRHGCLIIKFSNKLLRALLTEWTSRLEPTVDLASRS